MISDCWPVYVHLWFDVIFLDKIYEKTSTGGQLDHLRKINFFLFETCIYNVDKMKRREMVNSNYEKKIVSGKDFQKSSSNIGLFCFFQASHATIFYPSFMNSAMAISVNMIIKS